MVRAAVQRVHHAAVEVDSRTYGAIDRGLLVYLAVATDDTEADAVQCLSVHHWGVKLLQNIL